MGFLITVFFAIVVLVLYWIINNWGILLIALALGTLVGLLFLFTHKRELENIKNNLVKAEMISYNPIVERKAENTGYTVSYGRYPSSHEHYRYRNVVTGHKATFRCYLKDGTYELRTCEEESKEYNIIIAKVERE